MDNSRWLRFERYATAVMMVTSLCLSVTVVYGAWSARAAAVPTKGGAALAKAKAKQLSVGDKLNLLRDAGLSGKPAAVLFLSSKCRYCAQNADFYHQLGLANKRQANLIAVFSTRDKGAAQFIANHKIRVDRMLQLDDVPVSRVPTTVFADATGGVEQIWRGVLEPPQQSELLGRAIFTKR